MMATGFSKSQFSDTPRPLLTIYDNRDFELLSKLLEWV
jgi:hypothetical protein